PGTESEDILPAAVAPAGVDDACRALASGIQDNVESSHWMFLVGGPGNGKSFQLARFMASLGIEFSRQASNDPAPRSEFFQFGQTRVLVVNDASIWPAEVAEHAPPPLAAELAELATGNAAGNTFAIVNINRGV